MILDQFNLTRDPRTVTRWYWDWDPHPGQVAWLQAYDEGYREMYGSTGNRYGKSEMLGATAMMAATLSSNPEFPILVTSITMDQARIVWNFAEKLALRPRFERWVDDIVQSPFPTIRLKTGCEITARSMQYNGKYVEGHKYRLAIFDEWVYGNPEMVTILRVRVADVNGTVIGGASPVLGKNWAFRDCWRPAQQEMERKESRGAKPSMYVQTGSTFDNPHVSHDYVRNHMMTKLTPSQIESRIYGRWVDDERKLFRGDDITWAADADLVDDCNRLRDWVHEKPQSERDRALAQRLANIGFFVLGWDLAKSVDWTVVCGLDIRREPWRWYYYDRYQRRPWPMVEKDMETVARRLNSRNVAMDATGVGEVTFDHLNIESCHVEPVRFTRPLVIQVMTNLQRCLEQRKVKIPAIPELMNELHDFELGDYEDLSTDCVFAFALACWRAENRSLGIQET